MSLASIACLLINYRFPEDTIACISSIIASDKDAFKFFLINNDTDDGSEKVLLEFLESSGSNYAYFAPGKNLGYTGGMNLGIAAALAEGFKSILILNNDTVVDLMFAPECLATINANPGAVIAGTVLDSETGQISHNIGRLSKWTGLVKPIFAPGFQANIDFLSGCMMFVPSEVFQRHGKFDDRYFMYQEDFDFCIRLKKNRVSIIHNPKIVIRHKVSSSTDRMGTPKEYYRMRNQTHIIMHRATLLQKCIYWPFIILLLGYKIRNPRILSQYLLGIRDALMGKLGVR